MKKMFFVPLALLMVLCLSACEADNAASAEETERDAFDVSWMSDEELGKFIEDQDVRHNLDAYVYEGSWIYGPTEGGLAKMRDDYSEWTMIDWISGEAAFPYCNGVLDGYLYYNRDKKEGSGRELVKMRLSGKDATVIAPDVGSGIQITEYGIYYTGPETSIDEDTVSDDSSHLFFCGFDGENVECILDKPTYYFTVLGGWVLYQDDKDNCSMHLYNIESKEDRKLNDQASFWPIYDGEYLYYLSGGEGKSRNLWRLTLDASVNEEITQEANMESLSVKGDYLYFSNTKDEYRIYRCRKDGSGLELVTQDKNILLYQWLGENLAYIQMDDSMYYATGFFLCADNGSKKTEFKEPYIP